MASMKHAGSLENSKPNYTIGSAEKVCDILLALCRNGSPMGVSELGRELDYTKSTVHKLLLTLEYKGLVEQDLETSKYGLSLNFALMLQNYLNTDNLMAKIRPQMMRLVEKFDETTHLGVYRNGELVIVAKQEANRSVRVTSCVGKVSNLFCTSIGKVILSNLSDEEQTNLIAAYSFPRYTANTITNPDDFMAELKQIREQGYATDNEEYEEGIRCIAVPVFGGYHNLYGAISMTGPKFRMTDEKIAQIRDELLSIRFL